MRGRERDRQILMHTRNIAAHRYEVLDMDIVREILLTSIPELEAVLRAELRTTRPDDRPE